MNSITSVSSVGVAAGVVFPLVAWRFVDHRRWQTSKLLNCTSRDESSIRGISCDNVHTLMRNIILDTAIVLFVYVATWVIHAYCSL